MTTQTIELKEGEEIEIIHNNKRYRIAGGFDAMGITTLSGSIITEPHSQNRIKIKSTNDNFDLRPPLKYKVGNDPSHPNY